MQVAENDGAATGQGTTETGTKDDQTTGETLGQGTEGAQGGTTTDDETVVVTIGEEAPPSDEEETAAPVWVKELRKTNRELARENRELKQKQAPAAQQAATMPKPTLADCDFDEDAFETKLLAWQEQQAQARTQQQQKAAAEKKEQDAWQAKLDAHGTAKAALKVDDYEEAEAAVSEVFSQTQRAIIVSGADNSALVEYALGKNPAKLKELASITDPVKFAFAIARLESQLKVTPRKAAPPPEKVVRGNATAAGAVDSKLTSLEVEADRTGDRSKVIAYNREQRRKQA